MTAQARSNEEKYFIGSVAEEMDARRHAGYDQFPDSATFDFPMRIGADAISTMRKFRVIWNSDEFPGVPFVDPERPLNSPSAYQTMLALVGQKPPNELAALFADALQSFVILLRKSELAPGTYVLPWGPQSAAYIRSLGGTVPASLRPDGSFGFTEEHRRLLKAVWYGTPTAFRSGVRAACAILRRLAKASSSWPARPRTSAALTRSSGGTGKAKTRACLPILPALPERKESARRRRCCRWTADHRACACSSCSMAKRTARRRRLKFQRHDRLIPRLSFCPENTAARSFAPIWPIATSGHIL